MKKLALALVAVLTAGLLAACGSSFDASGYIQALLDNSYKNDSAAFVEMKIGTAEEAAALYEEGLNAELDGMLDNMDLPEEQLEEFRAIIAEILGKAKYTVGEAEKQSDGSYVVTVTYEQLNVFVPAMQSYYTVIEQLVTGWTEAALAGEATPTEDEMMTQMIGELKVCLEDAIANATYDEPATTTITIELIDKVYTPKEADLLNLETVMFDVEELQGLEAAF
ncbi:MAG: hypothetical protein PUI41_06130 [Lachnospiraceae bacterium]|nr:hypothetical protein [Lachnospiraceae bacterium]MCI7596745.1 hypothetical protein [Lachnospiraceae bacterium]MDD7050480.1 hypothetical protein [Lachnospiraceae bacterium]MDY4096015.1 hypothetical protein [Lachnospiraceae bacterium]